ncbi:DNA primase [Thalassoglobus polymorphus]|uniref:DNA primase n=1 Tax=Thalassoglobus polymorphus TaxID=2527994 RepID=A0A517QTW5_9PLAN|nr:DNA primase [Thalassoglobus polymorphus]QDT35085.1 DNA primase [Thalassoglobus polymorphus]
MPNLSNNQSSLDFKEEVRSHTDIVGLISESVALQPRSGGREYVGLCPFHDDHNPSMRVYPERQTFRCWSCSTGGDVFTFVTERESVTFPEAVEILARRANLEIPKFVSGRSPQQESSRARQFEVLQWAESLFQRTLLNSPEAEPARKYLHGRGIDEETMRKFRLGFHPSGWDWLIKQSQGKYPLQLLEDVCLVAKKDNGGYYDFFGHRIIFPIHNERGQAVSFSGRLLPGDERPSKYKNGSATPVFNKSRLLYALDLARDEIRNQDQAIVVEGYTDCIALHQHGIQNAVVTMGTALTDEQVTVLKRFARRVILCFDGDDAGQDAASRSVERFLAQDVDLRILTPPDKLDPADFLESHGADAFRELSKNAPQAWDFRFQMAKRKYGTGTIDGRERVLTEMLNVLAQVPKLSTSVRESILIADLAHRTSVPEETVRGLLNEVRSSGPKRVYVENHAATPGSFTEEVQRIIHGQLSSRERVECDLLQIVLAVPETIQIVENAVSTTPMRNRILKGILRKCTQDAWANGEFTLSGLLDHMPEKDLKSLVVWLDEQASAKGLANKIRESDVDEEGCPQLLRQSIEALQKDEARHSSDNLSIRLSQSTDGQTRSDVATEDELLLQAAEFHRKRATKKSGF